MAVDLPLGAAVDTFDLKQAVCSHGLFMMAPNYWHSPSKSLYRPLRLDPDGDTCLVVRISHPSYSPKSLQLFVFGVKSLSTQKELSLLTQVRRMLRLSEVEDTNVREFQKIHKGAKERGFGRMFRSPTLFEDMVKCMLLCNCQWPRTLFMARALSELQWELKHPPLKTYPQILNGTSPINGSTVNKSLSPNTPEGKETKRTLVPRKCSSKLSISFGKAKARIDADDNKIIDDPVIESKCLLVTENLCRFTREDDSREGFEFFTLNKIGNFPSPIEIANLDEDFLAKRCGLGYRASRILNLAQSIVEGKIQLRQLEKACGESSMANYSQLAEQLKEINGFGPYTCSNVLMCMGFYHVVPSDSETVRHLNQVHKRGSTLKSVQRDVEMIYGNYAPFQFLAYWWEVWEFYNEKFGKLSEMPPSDYKVITASNMKTKHSVIGKRIKSGINLKPQQKVEVKKFKNST